MATGSEIREQFLRFFESKEHRRVHSSSLVPANDPTLLFTNAGMNQFKDVFLGVEKREYSRATSSQKCVRAGGKHNDLENVGFTKRHHTLFEMLVNFSFGDYFKREAVADAWELVTSKQWYAVDSNKLYCTIFKGEEGVPRDDDAEKYWIEAGVPKERIFALGMKDNFWQMGETGPCGPSSEIHYDMGEEASDQGHLDCDFPCDCGRYVEIWNLVFMQFDRDAQGKLAPLPKPSIDTGMGLERIAAVLQGKLSNYDTDLFMPLIETAARLTGRDLKKELSTENKSRSSAASLRVIADHARATTFLISDGVLPANEGRGYVLRKILRGGIRHGRLLVANKPFMNTTVFAVRDLMKDAYPELVESAERVSKVVFEEERRFAHTLDAALSRLEPHLQDFRPNPVNPHRIIASRDPETELGITQAELAQHKYQVGKGMSYRGDHPFKLYDTFGLPLDFIMDACRDAGINLDVEGFERAMEAQRERARASWKGGAKQTAAAPHRDLHKTVFQGYRQPESDDCTVLSLFKMLPGSQGPMPTPIQKLEPGEEGEAVLDHTPFYADSGGQVGDVGVFSNTERTAVVAEVIGWYLPVPARRAHRLTP